MSSDTCCNWWEEAKKDGTDNEGYGPLIYIVHQQDVDLNMDFRDSPDWFNPSLVQKNVGKFRAGNGVLPILNFCPWCGTKK